MQLRVITESRVTHLEAKVKQLETKNTQLERKDAQLEKSLELRDQEIVCLTLDNQVHCGSLLNFNFLNTRKC